MQRRECSDRISQLTISLLIERTIQCTLSFIRFSFRSKSGANLRERTNTRVMMKFARINANLVSAENLARFSRWPSPGLSTVTGTNLGSIARKQSHPRYARASRGLSSCKCMWPCGCASVHNTRGIAAHQRRDVTAHPFTQPRLLISSTY